MAALRRPRGRLHVQSARRPRRPAERDDEMPEPVRSVWADDVARWRRKALKAGGACEFASDTIPDGIHNTIVYRLKSAKTPDEIKAAFDVTEERRDDAGMAALLNTAIRAMQEA